MNDEEVDEVSISALNEAVGISSNTSSEPGEIAPAANAATKWGLNRRKFLTAAALGTAAATFLNKGSGGSLNFGAASALANDLSTNPCTAQDVTVAQQAIVVNEPCTCSGATFNAQVAFTVTNHTGTSRYCVTLHIPSGFGVPAQDVVLGDIASDTTKVMIGTVLGFPCNANTEICIGSPGSDGRRKCDSGTCLTVAWNTSANAPCPDTSPPGGQCRHQRICIRGYGATLACTAGCTPSCGGTATLQACAIAPANRGPFTFKLEGSDGSTQTKSGIAGSSTGTTCVNFTVTVTQTTNYTLTVTDKDGCQRTATTSLSANPISASISVAGNNNCNGVLTCTANVTGGSGCSFTWKVDGNAAGGNSSTLTYNPILDGANHTVSVNVDCGGCTATASKTINQCVTTTVS